MRTVAQIQALCGSYIAPGASFILKLNQALSSLHDGGNWKYLTAEYSTDVSAGYFRLPPDWESVLFARINDCPVTINGMSYEYQSRGPGVMSPPVGTAFGLIDKGYVPLMSEIAAEGLDALDFDLVTGTYATGDTIVIEYTMTSGPGSTTLSPTSGSSVTLTPVDPITSIESITYTSLPARVVAKDVDDFIYAVLLSGDGVASYRDYQCPQVPPGTTDTWTVDAVVKRAFIPCVALTDKVFLDNTLALKYALLAITFEDAGDEERAALNWKKSTDILEKELSQARGGAKSRPQFDVWGEGVANIPSLYSCGPYN